MKKNLFFTLMLSLLAITSAFSQTVNDKLISEIEVEYIQIVGTAKLFSNKAKVDIDFGQLNKFFSVKDTQVKDKDGKLMVFNSMIDALNFFSANGYDFQQAYTITIGNQNVYHYLMKKKS